MVKKIIDLVRDIAQTHKLIRSFRYDQLGKAAGTGEDECPLVFLEMPLYFGNVLTMQGIIPSTFSLDIVLNPQALENFDVTQLTPESCQQIASQIAQQFIARMRNLYVAGESEVSVVSYSILTLQRWYDDNSYGVRLTVDCKVVNNIGFCLDDDYFDSGKTFDNQALLPDIDTDGALGCLSLDFKLPNIDL